MSQAPEILPLTEDLFDPENPWNRDNQREIARRVRTSVGELRLSCHASMVYTCVHGHEETIYLGVGVEGPTEYREAPCYIASPFGGPACLRCGEPTQHEDWSRDQNFSPRPIPAGSRAFVVPDEWSKEGLARVGTSTFCGEIYESPNESKEADDEK